MKSRKTIEFSESFNKRWLGYAAAGAAGVGMLATVQPAKADIIYTSAHTTIAPGTSFSLDLNHDGITDFRLTNAGGFSCFSKACSEWWSRGSMKIYGARAGNGIVGGPNASVLARGAPIGPGQAFYNNRTLGELLGRFSSAPGSFAGWGYWGWGPGGTTGYLGLEFQIGGQTHYGWAALTVSFEGEKGVGPYYELLTGYAYDTVAGQSIDAGQTSSTPEPGSLGLLALGSLGLGFWRRRKAATGDK